MQILPKMPQTLNSASQTLGLPRIILGRLWRRNKKLKSVTNTSLGYLTTPYDLSQTLSKMVRNTQPETLCIQSDYNIITYTGGVGGLWRWVYVQVGGLGASGWAKWWWMTVETQRRWAAIRWVGCGESVRRCEGGQGGWVKQCGGW